MADKESNYALGTKGLDLVTEPLALQDGDLQNAQNAEFRRDKAKQGLGKRGGLARLNASGLGGSVLGGANVPLPSPLSTTLVRSFHAALITADGDTWITSPNGTTWTEGTSPARAQTYDQSDDANFDYRNQRCVTFNGVLVYAGADYVQYPTVNHTAPPIRVFDGTTDAEICRIPYNPDSGADKNCILITDFVIHRNRLFVSVYDPGGSAPNHYGRVFELDIETGQLTQIGNRFGAASGGMPYTLASHNGLLWASTYGIAGASDGYIYSFRVDVDSTWTERYSAAGYVLSMVSYRGELYFGNQGDAGTAALVQKLATDNTTLTTSKTGSDTSAFNYYAGLTVYDDDLYAVYVSRGAGTPITVVQKFDAGSWTDDLDVAAAQTDADIGQAFVHSYNTSLLMAFVASGETALDGFIYRKISGVWTAVATGLNTRGMLGRVDTQ